MATSIQDRWDIFDLIEGQDYLFDVVVWIDGDMKRAERRSIRTEKELKVVKAELDSVRAELYEVKRLVQLNEALLRNLEGS